MAKYIIADISFSSKKAIEDYTRDKIRHLGECIISRDHHDFSFFSHLFKHHPEQEEKIGCGISEIHIRPNPMNGIPNHIVIKRLDDSEIPISWATACKMRPMTNNEKLNHALRYTIEPQILEYRRSLGTNPSCSGCHRITVIQIDHIYPFHRIRDDFFESTSLPKPTSFDTDPITRQEIFKEEDKELKKAWEAFHKAFLTNLQPLCPPCNLKKSGS